MTPTLSVYCWTEDLADNANLAGKPDGQDRVMLNELKDQLTLISDHAVLPSTESMALDLRISWFILMLPSSCSNSVIR